MPRITKFATVTVLALSTAGLVTQAAAQTAARWNTSTVQINGSRAEYRVIPTATGVVVTDLVCARNGSVSLSAVDHLVFDDHTVNLAVQARAASMAAADLRHLLELYVAFFNRVPDADGLVYWIDQFIAGRSIPQIAETFYAAGMLYPSLTGLSVGMSNADFVNIIYRNVFGRPADADPHGLAYWNGELASGRATRSSLVPDMLAAAHLTQGDPVYGAAAALLDNKLAVATSFAVTLGLNYLSPAASVSQGMAIAAAVTSTSTAAALALIGVSPSPAPLPCAAAGISVLAGRLGTPGMQNGLWADARFGDLNGITTDSSGNVYVADAAPGSIRKITPAGSVTPLLGQQGFVGTASIPGARIVGLAVDAATGVIYRSYSDGSVSFTHLTNPDQNSGTSFSYIMSNLRAAIGIALDRAGNVYVGTNTYVGQMAHPYVYGTLAGQPGAGADDYPGTYASFNGVFGVAVDSERNVYAADSNNRTVRKIDRWTSVSTLAGQAGSSGSVDGQGTAARFTFPRNLAVDGAGNVFVVDTSNTQNADQIDTGNGVIRKITPAGVVTTVAGQPGASGPTVIGALPGRLSNLRGIAVGADGVLYVNTIDAVLKIVLPTD